MVKIPEGWIETTLGQLADKVFSGGTPSTQHDEYYGGDIPRIRTQEVNFNYINDTEIKITEDGLNNSSAKRITKDTVIIAMYGNSAGRVAYSNIKATTNQACCNFIGNNKLCDSKFVYFHLMNRYSEIMGMANGAAQQNLSVNVLKQLNMIIPENPEEQKAIAGVLSSFDDKIELLRAENQTLEEMGQTLFKEWFGKYKVGDELPDGWKVGKLTDIANFLNGIALQKFPPKGDEKGLPVIKIREMKAGITEETDRATKDIDEKYIIQNEDVLFSWSGSLELVFWEYGPGALNQHLFKVSSNKYPKRFYYYRIKHHLTEFRAIASNKATTMGHIQRGHLEKAAVIIPNEDDLNKFDKIMDKLLKKLFNNKNTIHSLTETRDQLLPKLMSGEVRVEF